MSSTLMLLTKVLSGPTEYLLAKKAGLTTNAFLSNEETEVWKTIEQYFQKHTNVPPLEYVQKLIPTFSPVSTGKFAISELLDRVFKERVEIELRKTMAEVESMMLKEEYREAVNRMHSGASLASRGWGASRDLLMSQNAEMIYDTYVDVKEHGLIRGIPWPWYPLTMATGGILKATYSVFYGRMKSTKTFRLLEIASKARSYGNRVLIVSCEMADEVLMRRLAAIECGLDMDKLRHGSLGEDDEDLLQSYTEAQKDVPREKEIIVTQLTDSQDGRTVSALRAKIDEHEPQIVLVDAIYKMHDEQTKKRDGSPQTLRNISADLQQLALVSQLPFVVTTQANRSGIKVRAGNTADVAFSDALAMDCDILVRLVNDDELHRTVFLINAARDAVLDGFSVSNGICHDMGPVKMPDGAIDWSIPLKYRPQNEDAPRESPHTASLRFSQ